MILFAIAFIFIFFLAISILLWILKLIFKKKIFSTLNIGLWITFLILPFLIMILNFFNSKTQLDKEDIYGNYIINREKCAGKQADWQYNHYRFKITEDDKIFFYITEKENILKTIEGTVSYNIGYASPHIELNFEEPKFHILIENPTLYREIWTFYYVFESSKYGNMFFTKGKWKKID
jgi:hypothetical protein